jgi:hypothetical protein
MTRRLRFVLFGDARIYREHVSRRGRQGKRELRKAARSAARKLSAPTEGAYKPCDRAECDEKRWETAYDDANTVRLQFFLWRKAGLITEFVVNVQVLASEGWETIEYFDCCHGHCHLHPKSREGRERTVMRLDEIDDVQRAFLQVEKEAHERGRIIRGEGA